ncbi:hypothetical protein COCOBI_02-4390 [Coccomyxa sp. Obi]|nr:hypothetical protein COCOBI_02-4390 [Coccomyxa sp. Obi]
MPFGENTFFACPHDPQEGNLGPNDLSSTEPYQRDNVFHFLVYAPCLLYITRYWFRHAVGAWVELLVYALWRRRFVLLGECLCTETAYILAVYMLWQWRPVATLWTMVLPYFLSSLALMFGNWSQHIFINPDNPSSAYGMAYNCVACPDNAITFNDGYHIQHHLNSKSHWSELPMRFLDTFDEHARQQALVFQKIGVFEVGLAVFLGRFDFLVQHMLICGQPFASMDREVLVRVLKSRLKPIQR